jgi:hypothetical protein
MMVEIDGLQMARAGGRVIAGWNQKFSMTRVSHNGD